MPVLKKVYLGGQRYSLKSREVYEVAQIVQGVSFITVNIRVCV